MPFPEAQRIIFSKKPLRQVICQVRFPTILRIETELPARFQEAIRHEYPVLDQQNEQKLILPDNLPSPLANIVSELIPGRTVKPSFEFISEDDNWIVRLESGSLSLTTTDYERWETFREKLEIPFNALIEEYSPAFFSRIGLRYINFIRKSEIGFTDDTPWSELLEPTILGLLSSTISNNVHEHSGQTLVELTENLGKVRIRFGLGRDAENKKGFIIDNDFFNEERTQIDDTFKLLDGFKLRSSRLFQWLITGKLRNALDPETINS